MLVTVITDASYCSETGAAGYGYWVVSERGRASGGGKFSYKAESSLDAEMKAIVNGIYIALREGIAQEGDRVLVQTDCQGAILFFEQVPRSKGRQKQYTSERRLVHRWFADLVYNSRLRVDFRHVKGHTSAPGSRFYANRICDQLARSSMKEMRQILKGAENESQPSYVLASG